MTKLPALISLTLVLAACGASQPSTPATSTTVLPGAQVLTGTVTALSADHQSLTVAGQTLHLGLSGQSLMSQRLSSQRLAPQSGGTVIKVNGDDANDLALSIGQHVTVQAKDDAATEVEIQKELRGMVSSIDLTAGTLVVNGQTVTVSAGTRFELSRHESSTVALTHTLADLKVGNFVEVTGDKDAAGVLTASSIEVRTTAERREQGQNDQAELHGTISGLDAAAKTFSALGTQVDYHLATVRGTPAEGSRVEVKGTFDSATKVLLATRVRVEAAEGHGDDDHAPAAGEAIRLEDRVKSLDTAARTLVAGQFTVDYAKATVTGTPAVRSEVRVRGQLDATDPHLVHATEVRFSKED